MKWLLVIFAFLAGGAVTHFAHELSYPNRAVRTDLQVYRDAETGCEYVKPAWGFGGLTPRNDSLGVPICRDEKVGADVEKLLDDVGSKSEEKPDDRRSLQ